MSCDRVKLHSLQGAPLQAVQYVPDMDRSAHQRVRTGPAAIRGWGPSTDGRRSVGLLLRLHVFGELYIKIGEHLLVRQVLLFVVGQIPLEGVRGAAFQVVFRVPRDGLTGVVSRNRANNIRALTLHSVSPFVKG